MEADPNVNPGVGVAIADPKPIDGADAPVPLPPLLLLPNVMAGADDPVDPEPNPPNPPNPPLVVVLAAFIAPVAAGMVGDIIELEALLGEAPNPPKPVLLTVAAPVPLLLPNANGDAVDVVDGADAPNPVAGAIPELPKENEGTDLAGCEDVSVDAAAPPRVNPPLG